MKIGSSNDIKEREPGLKRNYGKILYKHVILCEDAEGLEKWFHKQPMFLQRQCTELIKGHKRTELMYADDNSCTLDHVAATLRANANVFTKSKLVTGIILMLRCFSEKIMN